MTSGCTEHNLGLRLERPSGPGGAPRGELIASGGALDQPAHQPAPAQSERWEHVFAAVAPDVRPGRGPIVRAVLRKTPDSCAHPITFEYLLSPSVGASW